MLLLSMLLAQSASSAPPETIDLTVRSACDAERASREEVVVCGRRGNLPSPYRLNLPPAEQSEIPKAETQIADGVKLSAETEQEDISGFPSNRLMIRLKIKF